MIRAFRTTILALLLVTSTWSVAGAVPSTIPYQGRLTDAAGAVINGAQSVVFALYTVASGGAPVYSETQTVTVNNGQFSVQIGTVTPIPNSVFTGASLFLGVKVGADAEMTPRQPLGSVGYAQRAGTVDVTAGVAFKSFFNKAGVASQIVVVDSIDITIPAAGFIEVEAGGNAYTFHGTSGANGTFKVDESRFNTGFAASYIEWPFNGSIPASLYEMSLVCHRIYQKPAGSYRFYFNMGSGAETVNMQAGWISAKFFPTALGPTSAPQSDPQLNFGESARPASEQVKP